MKTTRKILLSALSAFVLLPLAASAAVIDTSNYDHAMSIKPHSGKVSTTLSNFPLLVRLSTTRQSWFDPADCAAGGADLRFALSDGTLLAHEIDYWNANGESTVWVNVPSLSADTEIIAYWGVKDPTIAPQVTASDAWPDFVGVWHFSEESGVIHDSSGNGYDSEGDGGGTVSNLNGKVGLARNTIGTAFYSTTNLVDTSAAKPLTNVSRFSVSGWMIATNFTNYSQLMLKTARHGQPGWYAAFDTDSKKFYGVGSGTTFTTITLPTSVANNWIYLTVVFNDTACRIYENGQIVKVNNSEQYSITKVVNSFDKLRLANGCRGRIDEFRIRNGAGTASYMNALAAADYATQTDPSFLDYEEIAGSGDNPAELPSISLSIGRFTASSAVASVSVESFGKGATGLSSLTLSYGTDPSDESGWTSVPLTPPAATGGVVRVTLSGLAPNTAHYAKVTAVNDLVPPKSGVATMSFTPHDPTFLEKLRERDEVVPSSPYATGGDVILRLGAYEYVHVFTNAGTFSPASGMNARVLVVGGGGGGGGSGANGGGGGGGGMVDKYVTLSAGTGYAVVAGKGGAATSYYGEDGKAGSQSSFGGTLLVAGGGNGGKTGPNSAVDNSTKRSGTPQSHTGGDGFAGIAKTLSYGLGSGWGGRGGPGLDSDILGEAVEFAAGGNGGCSTYAFLTSAQGYGGTGNFSGSTYGTAGENGTGSGGGNYNARGGDGIVVVRYVAWAGAVPLAGAVHVAAGATYANVSASLSSSGADDAATLKVHIRQAGDSAWGRDREIGEVSASNIVRTASVIYGGLVPATTYEYEVWASNGDGDSAVVAGTFATLAADAVSTGGAITTNGFRRVHTFTSSGTLSLASEVVVDYLVVGGGGSGGYYACGGGGGGGEVIYRTSVTLPAGNYPVVVGAGGTSIDVENNSFWATVNSEETALAAAGAMGGNTTFNGETAHGGAPGNAGSGYNAQILTGWFRGASGGGACSGLGDPARAGVSGFWAAGHNGGADGSDNKCGAGGGGAGGNGRNSTSTSAGNGGAGVEYSISGTAVYYGAGGGGATSLTADWGQGGSGVGGDGGHAKTADDVDQASARCGKDGAANTGSGGGGAYGSLNSKTYLGGRGADGVVIVSYIDYSLSSGSGEPVVEGPVDLAPTAASADFRLNVVDVGGGDGTVTLTAHYGYSAEALTMTQVLATDVAGPVDCTLAGLNPGVTYYLSVTADNGAEGGAVETEVVSFTTLSTFSGPLSYTAAGAILGYAISGVGSAGTQWLELWVGPDAQSRTNQATYVGAEFLTTGAHSLHPFSYGQFGEDVSVLLRHVAVVGDRVFTNDTATLLMTVSDGAIYTWKSDVADGLWCDAENWTASVEGGRGWPTVGSTAKFPNMTATARIDRAVTVAQTQFTANGAVTLLGTVPGATLTTGFSSDTAAFPAGTWTLDAIALVRNPAVKVTMNGNNANLVLTNGASYACASQDFSLGNSTASATVREGSSLSVKNYGGSGTAGGAMPTFLLEGTVAASAGINLSYGGAANKPGMHLVLSGASSRVTTGNGTFYSQNTNAVVTLQLRATGGYSETDALIKQIGGSTRMAASGYTLTFDAPASREARNCPRCDILVADWTLSSINASKIAFGEVDNERSYFYFSEAAEKPAKANRYLSAAEVAEAGATVRCLWYHHDAQSGTVILLQ